VHPDVVEQLGLSDSFEVLGVRVRDGAEMRLRTE
jgi:hypothetical protein